MDSFRSIGDLHTIFPSKIKRNYGKSRIQHHNGYIYGCYPGDNKSVGFIYRFNPYHPLDKDYKKMFVDIEILPNIYTFTIYSNSIYCLTYDPSIIYEIDTELTTITPHSIRGIPIPLQENITYSITCDTTNLYISIDNIIYVIQNYVVTNCFTLDNPITNLWFHEKLYFFTQHSLNDAYNYFGYIHETPIFLSNDFAINETPYETSICSYHDDFIYFNYTVNGILYIGQYSNLNNTLTSIYIPYTLDLFAGITFDNNHMYIRTNNSSLIYKSTLFGRPIQTSLNDYSILTTYSLILEYFNGNIIVTSGKYGVKENSGSIIPSFSKDNKLLPNAIQELTSFYTRLLTVPSTHVLLLKYKSFSYLDVTQLATTIDEICIFTPGKWITMLVDELHTLNDLTIKSNSTIVFNGNSDSVFIIQAKNILVENNVTFVLNNVNAKNIFWITTNNIHIDSTTFTGNIISNHLTCNNLILTGHVYVGTVTGNLTIYNDIPVPIISDVCFAQNTCIETDQGVIFVQDLKQSHTIRQQPIAAITKTILFDDFLICFEKHTFERNCPSQRTIVSKDHKIKYKDKFISAYKFIIPRFINFVHKIPYDEQPLYTVLMNTQTTLRANNLVCETVDPVSMNEQLYATNTVTNKYTAIMKYNIYLKNENQKNTRNQLI